MQIGEWSRHVNDWFRNYESFIKVCADIRWCTVVHECVGRVFSDKARVLFSDPDLWLTDTSFILILATVYAVLALSDFYFKCAKTENINKTLLEKLSFNKKYSCRRGRSKNYYDATAQKIRILLTGKHGDYYGQADKDERSDMIVHYSADTMVDELGSLLVLFWHYSLFSPSVIHTNYSKWLLHMPTNEILHLKSAHI